jgi:hypothetical protein
MACALAWVGLAAASAGAACRAWPGEPDPLPQIGSADAFAESWTRLRREELRGLALLLEASDPLEARRIWLHAACLAPGDAEIAAALARTARPIVHRISVEVAPVQPRAPAATLGGALDVLASEARVAPAPREPALRPAARSAPADLVFDFTPVDAQIRAAAEHLDQALFQQAADLSDLARARLARLASAPPVRARRVRIELLGATARLALGREGDARRCLERALREDPDLAVDPAVSPPKLQRLLEEARASAPEHTP